MNARILANHEDYRVTLHQADEKPSEKLVVTFGGKGSGLSEIGFGTSFCLKNKWDTVYVAQKPKTQYQQLSLDQFFDALHPVANGRDLVFYGSSLGAYASFYYGGIFDAQIIGIAPLLPAWPPCNPLPHEAVPVLHEPLEEVAKSNRTPIVLYDPNERLDQIMMSRMILPSYPDTRIIKMDFAGHMLLLYLAKAKLINKVAYSLVERAEMAEVDLPTETSALWLFNKARHLASSDPLQARVHYEKSLALEPSRQVLTNLIDLLIRTGDHELAKERIEWARSSNDERLTLPPGLQNRIKNAGIVA